MSHSVLAVGFGYDQVGAEYQSHTFGLTHLDSHIWNAQMPYFSRYLRLALMQENKLGRNFEGGTFWHSLCD